MNATMALVAALLLSTAILLIWRAKSIRDRRRRVLAPTRRSGVDPDDALVEWIRDLARGQDRPIEALDGVAASAQPGVLAQPTPSGGRTAVAWFSWDLDDGPARSRATGGPAGPTRPAGPGRPPARRDSRRPSAIAGPEAGILKAVDSPHRAAGGQFADQAGNAAGGLFADSAGHAAGGLFADSAGHAAGGLFEEPAGPGGGRLVAEPAGPEGGGQLATRPVRVRRSPRRVLLLVGLAGAGVGGVAGGPVAAVAMAGYGALATRALLRWRTNRQAELIRRHALDLLCGLAADLRAGLPVPPAFGIAPMAGASVGGADRLRDLTSAAVRLADRTGAPLAELVERIEADARATDRGLAAAAAQAAGARATAWLLAALPIGGIGLGYGIGVDPLAVLLHDTVGGVCAVLAVALQIVGLFWAERLGAGPGRTT
ncbi:type II secretion system F family protein [Micromonospora sp. CA-249363]|uniref:type II secretion system F family protein n=1 Tax=Micromonospora sp. CA-249363 TaxID=3239963 RepID=UPI003D8DA829